MERKIQRGEEHRTKSAFFPPLFLTTSLRPETKDVFSCLQHDGKIRMRERSGDYTAAGKSRETQ